MPISYPLRRGGGNPVRRGEIPRGEGGVPKGSTAQCAEVYTLFKENLDERAGAVPSDVMQQVDAALMLALGIAP